MSQSHDPEQTDSRIHEIASSFQYPATPDMAGRARENLHSKPMSNASVAPRRRLALIVVASVALLLVSLLTVPQVQAVARYLLRIGSVEIVAATPTPAGVIQSGAGLELAGEMPLWSAQQLIPFSLRQPTYPADLGGPDKVYLQQQPDGAVAVLIWTENQRNKLSLSISDSASLLVARDGGISAETTVNGHMARWIRGSQQLQYHAQDGQTVPGVVQLVGGPALLWEADGVYYWLEVAPTVEMAEAVRIAESLAPLAALPSTGGESANIVLAGETTLARARDGASYEIRLPTAPGELGPPDRVFAQNLGNQSEQTTILIWLATDAPERAALSLWLLPGDVMAEKTVDDVTKLEETTVNGAKAAWVRGPHVLRVIDANGRIGSDVSSLVAGNVLIWEENGITYRLETSLSLPEAQRIADSLR